MNSNQINKWLKENLVCPRDHNKVIQLNKDILICSLGHKYPVINGIPIMLLEDEVSTQPAIFNETLKKIKSLQSSFEQANKQSNSYFDSFAIDPFVQEVIAATCGLIYKPLINKLSRYPIPRLPLAETKEGHFLDIGCNWGRWCISASRLGYISVGIDHNLDSIMAAQRVARQLGVTVYYLVADARYLPFPEDTFDVIFSYSVLQHFSKNDAKICLSEIFRVMKISGFCMVQMANLFGIRNLINQLKRGFKKPEKFEVRYWSPCELVRTFSTSIGPTFLSIDGFFSLNVQKTDKDLLPFWFHPVIDFSGLLRRIGKKIKCLQYLADSLYVKAVKQ
jgi:ubiquinone/menaquinone biosynthesis C-methylase UbiE/uncharacterized protein YbaR (Trm112 family)